ncbi:MAG: hypothetical protein KA712_17580 [Myxococcales bacterium]|nr:hypothetical protein [Myxococcales bacterium]
MTNVEALLTVESGKVPDGVQVFSENNPDAGRMRAWLFLSAFLALVATVMGVEGGEPLGVMAIVVFAAMAAVAAIPVTLDEPRKPRVLLLCDKGLIVREHWGLRNWRYDELLRASVLFVDGEQQLCLEDRQGELHLVDHLNFAGGARLRILLEARIRAASARP